MKRLQPATKILDSVMNTLYEVYFLSDDRDRFEEWDKSITSYIQSLGVTVDVHILNEVRKSAELAAQQRVQNSCRTQGASGVQEFTGQLNLSIIKKIKR